MVFIVFLKTSMYILYNYMRGCITRSVETIAVSSFPKMVSQFYCAQVSTGIQSIIDIVLLVYNLHVKLQ